jgi:hypothetical protein
MRGPRLLCAALLAVLVVFLPVGPVAGAPLATHIPWNPRISIVWPHDERGNFAPVERAPLVNVAVDLFVHGTLKSVPPDFEPDFMDLMVVEGNNLPQRANKTPVKTTYTVNGQTFPRWVFNDVPVKPGGQFHFLVYLIPFRRAGFKFNTTVWTHAPDARTFLPQPELPPPCLP